MQNKKSQKNFAEISVLFSSYFQAYQKFWYNAKRMNRRLTVDEYGDRIGGPNSILQRDNALQNIVVET